VNDNTVLLFTAAPCGAPTCFCRGGRHNPGWRSPTSTCQAGKRIVCPPAGWWRVLSVPAQGTPRRSIALQATTLPSGTWPHLPGTAQNRAHHRYSRLTASPPSRLPYLFKRFTPPRARYRFTAANHHYVGNISLVTPPPKYAAIWVRVWDWDGAVNFHFIPGLKPRCCWTPALRGTSFRAARGGRTSILLARVLAGCV